MTSIRSAMAVVLVMGLLVASAGATILHVPSQYPTIQAGIDAAVDGDTVLVADGTYTGDGNRDIDFGGTSIVVMSENGPEATIIDCEGSEQEHHRGFLFHTGEDANAVVQGFTIRNGYATKGGGICINFFDVEPYPTIVGNRIEGNTATGSGGGIYCSASSSIIVGNTITGNRTITWEGGGIYCTGGGYDPIIGGNTITANIAGYRGGGIFCNTSSPIIAGNTIAGNTGTANAGAIACFWSADPIIDGNTITGNTSNVGGSIVCAYWASPMVINSILWGDSASTGQEIALYEGSSITVAYSNVEAGSSAAFINPGCTLYWEDGNIDADPIFVHEDWKDYRLLWGSPCIDAGQPDLWDPDGTRRDMGRYIFDQSKALVTYLTPETLAVHPGESWRVLYTLVNCHDAPQPCWGIAELTLPNGEPWPGNPLEGPDHGIMHRQYNWQCVREYEVPEMWPFGWSDFMWQVGLPANLFDKDRFSFAVLPQEGEWEAAENARR
ncbi:hypothetical protein AMJ39_05200 [candidate division TA06 bacterium DG_24]|uniref:Periplasmic copper-binding protein NosD beta helix domain-containing protein n=1 Tax=candidate division TA06 bacterium DG_24 TaxID=1703770 RepID=A0A0S7WT21_UNCT6|nr:MAG: hypothetical protein AMJ39_05200 [candidate division TA06 bacterium DG_24]